MIMSSGSQAMGDNYEWQNVTMEAAFQPRDGAGALVYKDAMYLVGGWSRDRTHFPRICRNDVWRSRDGLAWEMIKPNTFIDNRFDSAADWEGRHTAGYVVFQDRIWIAGPISRN